MLFSVKVTTIDFIKWVNYFIFKGTVLSKYLKRSKFEAFSKQLNTDLYFIILMVSSNDNDITASELINELFEQQLDKINDDYIIMS